MTEIKYNSKGEMVEEICLICNENVEYCECEGESIETPCRNCGNCSYCL